MEEVRDDVGRTGEEENADERQHGDTRRRALGSETRPVEQVVRLMVLGETALERRPHEDQVEDETGQDERRNERLEGDRVAKTMEAPRRPYSKRPVEEAHVPVRLDGVADARRVVRAELPDRVDLGEGAEQRGDAADNEQVTSGLGHEDREHG